MDNGYDDLETCKKIRGADLRVLGFQDPAERFRIQAAVKDLQETGATKVYIMAAACPISLATPRRIPLSLLTKMIRIRMRNEGFNLSEFTPRKENLLPLGLVHLAFRYSCIMKVPMVDVEEVIMNEWIRVQHELEHSIERDCVYTSPKDDSCTPYSISTLSVQYSRLPSSFSVPQSLVLPPTLSRNKYPGVSRSKSSDCSLSSSSSDSRSPSMERSKENLLDVTSLFSNLRFKSRTRQRISPVKPNPKPRMLEQGKVSYGFDSPF
ncbi:uncharacterized protein LOC111711194 [Eurytemora carolleeae]|uniref:uncharacterized protein LOC111711194 n=1 Tax=Eurytemora carolleeae TaxID=1294199 RepID=UPI000C760E05|nr:uncharacterized protein LOC111711194 [Eurytemora carolleeae]|eukprot:XP_023341248.1 uncharacterized protein LOC111711194 [Eurytemora affinis]